MDGGHAVRDVSRWSSNIQAAGGAGGVVHKASYGTASTGDGPTAGTRGRGADGGICHRPDSQPAHARGVRRGRDAVLPLVRRARARACTDFTDRGGHLHRRHARPISRPLDQAASGRHPPAVRLTGDRAGGARQPGRLGPWTDPRRQDGQDAGAAARRSAAAAGLHRHVDPPRPARSRAAGRDGLQLCARLRCRWHARGAEPVQPVPQMSQFRRDGTGRKRSLHRPVGVRYPQYVLEVDPHPIASGYFFSLLKPKMNKPTACTYLSRCTYMISTTCM